MTGGTGWTIPGGLRQQVRRGLKGKPFQRGYAYTWVQAGVWAYAILNGFRSYRELSKPLFRAQGIQAIGMTNLKKTGGDAASNREEISKHAKSEVNLWQKELEIMAPDLVICGNTYHDVTANLKLPKTWLLTHKKTHFFYSLWDVGAHKAIILRFWHPARRGNRAETLYKKKRYLLELYLIDVSLGLLLRIRLLQCRNQLLLLKEEFGNCPPRPPPASHPQRIA